METATLTVALIGAITGIASLVWSISVARSDRHRIVVNEDRLFELVSMSGVTDGSVHYLRDAYTRLGSCRVIVRNIGKRAVSVTAWGYEADEQGSVSGFFIERDLDRTIEPGHAIPFSLSESSIGTVATQRTRPWVELATGETVFGPWTEPEQSERDYYRSELALEEDDGERET